MSADTELPINALDTGSKPASRNKRLVLGGFTLALLVASCIAIAVANTKKSEPEEENKQLKEVMEKCGIYFNSSDPTSMLTPDQIFESKTTAFPPDFIWGTATAAYQIEGAVDEDGRGPTIWDTFSHTNKKVFLNQNGDVACDHYHRYKEDVQLIKSLGLKHYRFSIAWARIYPRGVGEVNPKGLEFYNNLVDELLAAGIQPYVTLYHWDLPQALEDKGGWRNDKIIDAYANYAETMFKALGDRVKFWITFNEPWCTSILGHAYGAHAPGIKEPKKAPYLAAHYQLLSHAAAVKVYRAKYQKEQAGKIGITLNSDYKQARCQNSKDLKAAERAQTFMLGWFADPVFKGDYPELIKERVGDRLPVFTEEQKKDLNGSSDFFGFNTYTTQFITGPAKLSKGNSYPTDVAVIETLDARFPRGESTWLYIVPFGLRKVLNWIKNRYDNPPIIITENGFAGPFENELTDERSLLDNRRVEFMQGYISEIYKAMEFDKVNLKGYFYWSLMDNFEWADGYVPRFGMVRVNYTTQERFPKKSARLFSQWAEQFSGATAIQRAAVPTRSLSAEL